MGDILARMCCAGILWSHSALERTLTHSMLLAGGNLWGFD